MSLMVLAAPTPQLLVELITLWVSPHKQEALDEELESINKIETNQTR